LMQFTGQPLITATNYEREALRCAKCQQRYVAPLPEGVVDERYGATCDAAIALMRYGGGLPWHRQAGLQATMWERCEATADAAMGIFLRLMRLAANTSVEKNVIRRRLAYHQEKSGPVMKELKQCDA
jgi:transposase